MRLMPKFIGVLVGTARLSCLMIAATGPAFSQSPHAISTSPPPQMFMGSASASVTIIEFKDYQCPYCKRYRKSTFLELKTDYIDKGKVRYGIRDLPLPIHRLARVAAHATHCAKAQGHYWEYSGRLLEYADRMSQEIMFELAETLGLDSKEFDICMESQDYFPRIDADIEFAARFDVTGVPSFLVFATDRGVQGGKLIVGAQAYEVFEEVIADVLKND